MSHNGMRKDDVAAALARQRVLMSVLTHGPSWRVPLLLFAALIAVCVALALFGSEAEYERVQRVSRITEADRNLLIRDLSDTLSVDDGPAFVVTDVWADDHFNICGVGRRADRELRFVEWAARPSTFNVEGDWGWDPAVWDETCTPRAVPK